MLAFFLLRLSIVAFALYFIIILPLKAESSSPAPGFWQTAADVPSASACTLYHPSLPWGFLLPACAAEKHCSVAAALLCGMFWKGDGPCLVKVVMLHFIKIPQFHLCYSCHNCISARCVQDPEAMWITSWPFYHVPFLFNHVIISLSLSQWSSSVFKSNLRSLCALPETSITHDVQLWWVGSVNDASFWVLSGEIQRAQKHWKMEGRESE